MKNLVLIDLDCVTNLSEFVLTLLPDTEYVAVGLGKKFSEVKALIPDKQYVNVALVQHNMKTLEYKMMMHDSQTRPSRVCDVEIHDPELSSWGEIKDFLQWLRDTRGMQNFDLLACDLWADKDWKYIIGKLKSSLHIGVRASLNITGIDGDYVLESDNVDTIGLYFNEDVKQYPQNFFAQINYQNMNNAPILDGSGGWYYKNKYANKLNDAFQATSDANYITLPYDVSNVVQVMGLTFPAGYGIDSYALLRKDGSVVRWGHKSMAMFNETEVTNASLTNIKRLYGGRHTFMALKNDGTVMGWGNIGYGIGNASTPYTDTQYIKAIPADASNIKEIYVSAQAYWGLTNDKKIISWGFRRDGGDTSLCDHLLVNIKKVVIANNVFVALREDGNVVVCGLSDPWNNVPCKYATTVGNASWDGKVIDVFSGGFAAYALVSFNGTLGIQRLWFTTTNVVANAATAAGTLSWTLYTLPAGVSILDTCTTATGSIIIHMSNNTSAISYQNTFYVHNSDQIITNNGNISGWINPKVYLSRGGAVITGTDLASVGGSVYDATYGIPAGADVSGNVVRLYSAAYNTFCALKSNGTVVTWGVQRYNSAAANIYDIVGVVEMRTGFIFFRSNGSFYSIGVTGYTSGTIPAGKTFYLYEGGRVEGDGFMDNQLVELDVEESYTSTVMAYSNATITYKSNRWERMARRGMTYGLYSGSTLVSTFVPKYDTYTYEFKNAIIPEGTTSLSVGSGAVNFANTFFSFPITTAPNPYVSAPDSPSITNVTINATAATSTVSFTLPTWNGGIDVNAMKYSINGGLTYTSISLTSPFTISGLINGSYELLLIATNPVGDSYPATTTIIMCDPPTAPVLTALTAGNRTMTVAFTAPVGGTSTSANLGTFSGLNSNTYTLSGNANALLNGTYVYSASDAGSAYSAFDNNNGTSWSCSRYNYSTQTVDFNGNNSLYVYNSSVTTTVQTVGTVSGEWLQVKYPCNVLVSGYSFCSIYSNSARLPYEFYLVGSRDGTTWFPIDKRTEVYDQGSGTVTLTIDERLSEGAFSYYRFIVTKVSTENGLGLKYLNLSGIPVASNTITGYKVSVNGGAFTSKNVFLSPFKIGGYSNNATYTVAIKAINAAGESPSSNTMSVTLPATVPDSPRITAHAFGDKSISLTYTIPNNGGAAITAYKYALNGGSYVNFPSISNPLVITGLANGTAYTVSIMAVNSVGSSTRSNIITNTPKTVPAKPWTTYVIPSNGKLRMHYNIDQMNNDPNNYGGSYILSVKYSVNGGEYVYVPVWYYGYVDITGLTNGTEYSVRFIASNAVGESVPSDPTIGIPCDVPGAPLLTNVTAVDGTAVVSLTQASNGGRPITQYQYMFNNPFSHEIDSMLFTGSRVIEVPNHEDLKFGTGDFTIEWYQYFHWLQGMHMRVFSFGKESTGIPLCFKWHDVFDTGHATFHCKVCVNNTWYDFGLYNIYEKYLHMAICRVNGMLRVFINGTQFGDAFECTADISPTERLLIGNDETFYQESQFFGNLLAFTYIKGWGKYVDTFTPPTYPILSVPQGTLSLFIVGRDNQPIGTLGSTAIMPTFESWGKSVPAGYFSPSYVTVADDIVSPFTITGLTNGQTYSVAFRAKNEAGYSLTSNKLVFTPMSVPDAPVFNSVTYGNISAVIDFSANVLEGNSPIIGYKLSTNDGPFISLGMISSPYTVSGLVNGTTYSFRLKAVSAIGDSPVSLYSDEVVPHRVPDAPVISIIENILQATVSFTQGASNGGSEILSYIYSYDDGEEVSLLAPQDQIYTLELGVQHTFRVRVTNDAGSSSTTSVTLTGKTFPDAPVITSIDAGNKSARVYFTAGSDNYSAITSYKYKLNGGELHTATVSDSSILISGLSENVQYSIVLVAVNAIGSSEESNSMSVTPYTVPVAPTLDSVTAGNSSVTFSFTPGAANSSEITTYKYSLNNKPYVALATMDTTVELTDVSNGILYNLKVKATNAAGDSLASNSLNFMPYTIPDAPAITSVTAGNESADLYFVPGFFNGSNITQYKYALNGGVYDGTQFTAASELASPIHIEGLENGTVYTLTMLAVNAAGESNASNSSTSFAPFITQSTANPPIVQSIEAGNGSVAISYVDDFNPGSAIIGYKYSLNGSAYVWFSQTTSPLRISGLQNGTTYNMTIKSVNYSGASVPSPQLSFVPRDVPDAPLILNAIAGDGCATLYLAEPVSNGADITAYYCSLNGDTYYSVEMSGNQIVLGSLVNGTEYIVHLKCENEIGMSAESNESELFKPVGLPTPPTITDLVVGDEMVTVSFDAADGNGAEIIKYSYCLIADGVAGLYLSTEDLTSPIVITGLTNGVTYALKMKTMTSVGESVESVESENFVPFSLPFAPIITKATYSDNILQIYFTETNLNGKPVSDHLYSLDGDIYYSSSQLTSPIDVSNLLIGSSTTVFIKTVTEAGESVASNESTSFVAYAPPVSPTISAITALDRGLSVQFIDGSFNGTNLIGYKYSVDETNYFWCNTTVSPIVITGLTNGTPYTVSLKTVTDRGETDAHTFGTAVSPSSLQLPPNIINTDISNGSIIIEFTNPQLYGSVVSEYMYSLNGDDYVTATSVDMVNNKITISGLSNGTSYSVTIKSVSNQGTSLASNISKTVKPYAAPSAPVISKVTTGSQIAYVHFTDGALNGSPAILGYKYSLDNVNYTWSSVTTSPIPLTGLTNSLAYTVRLIAVTSVNQSAPSGPSQTFIPFALPEPPTITSVTAGIGMATVTFTAGATNGRPLTGYKYSVNGGALVSLGLVSSFTVTGLEIGVPHYVTMYAVNAAGTSISSVPSQSFVPYNTPGAPEIDSLTPVRNGILVKVKNPVLNGTDFNDIPIIGYAWSFNPSSGFVTVSTANNASSFTISNLQNGYGYQIYVKSVTSIGISPASAISPQVVPGDVPDAPTITSVTALDQKMMVYFTDGSNNGAEITGYKYTVDGGLTYYTALQNTSPLTLFSLSNAESYSIQLKATNSMGDSVASNVSDAATPFGVPYAPVITEIIPGNACAYVYFDTVDDNGSPIIKFKYSLGSTIMDVSGLTSPLTIPNLINKTVYNIVIIANNAAGDSYTSNIKSVIAGAPTAPTVTEVVPGAKNIKVYFDLPLDNGSPITQYNVTFDGIKFIKAPGLVSPITLGGLANGTSYNITLQAVNKNGASKLSNTIPNQIPYDIPAKISISSVLPKYSSALVTFAPPLNNGSPITKYAYAMGADTVYTDISGLVPPLLIPDLPNNTSYTLKLIAYNAAGPSPVSAPSKAAIYIYTPPAQIKLKSIVAAKNSLIVDFLPPAANGAVITTYKYALNTDTVFTDRESTVVPFTITGLDNNTNYNIRIIATNEAGDSLPSAPAAKPVQFVFLPSAAPVVTSIVGGNQNGLIYFTAPKTNGAPVTGYKCSVDGGATKIDLVGTTSPLLVSGLTNDTTYNLVLYADSEAGLSPASAVKSFKPIYSAPDKPVIGTIISMNGGAFVTFTAGLENGSPITNYLYSLDAGVTKISLDSANLSFSLSGLTNDTNYSLLMYAVNAVGTSVASAPKAFMPVYKVPAAPTVGTIATTASSASVSFTPGLANGAPISSYKYSLDGVTYTEVTSLAGPIVITGLTTKTTYNVRLIAVNEVGDSLPSAPKSFTTK